MRKLHRWIAPLAVLFLTVIAVTGVWLQAEALWQSYHPEPEESVSSLPLDGLPDWLRTTVAAARRVNPAGTVALILFRMDGAQPRADVIWTAHREPDLTLDPRNGERFERPGAEASDRGLGRRLTRAMLRLHRGDVLGVSGQWLGLVCGVALLTLSLTGLVMYLKIYRQRIKLRRWAPN